MLPMGLTMLERGQRVIVFIHALSLWLYILWLRLRDVLTGFIKVLTILFFIQPSFYIERIFCLGNIALDVVAG